MNGEISERSVCLQSAGCVHTLTHTTAHKNSPPSPSPANTMAAIIYIIISISLQLALERDAKQKALKVSSRCLAYQQSVGTRCASREKIENCNDYKFFVVSRPPVWAAVCSSSGLSVLELAVWTLWRQPYFLCGDINATILSEQFLSLYPGDDDDDFTCCMMATTFVWCGWITSCSILFLMLV